MPATCADGGTACTGPCEGDRDCDDGDPCNGVEECSSEGTCASGVVPEDGARCDADDDPRTREICLDRACVPSRCGDGHADALSGEHCDDGNLSDGDGCSATCESEGVCGNGYADTEFGEVCDDGNTEDGDGCGADCRSDETCGNGVLDSAAGEVCDDGNNLSDDGCSPSCTSESCGNGEVEADAGEVCDDGNTEGGDGCNASCSSDETCGNGVVDSAAGEVCDDGNTEDGDGCGSACTTDERCGNGVVDAEAGEVCDDGNDTGGDGCSADCTSDETCGNGMLDGHVGELCDDGNAVAGDGCSATCSSESCGDGAVDGEAGEVCDDGNTDGGDGCSATCASDESCGNGVVDRSVGEVCDDGNTNPGDGCSGDCGSTERCGNGIVDAVAGEVCDDGNTSGGDGCSADCASDESCGNGIVDAAVGEECDAEGETATCDDNCTWAVCGDGLVNETAGETCDARGETSSCDSDCTPVACGDGNVNASAGEECDDGNTSDGDRCTSECVATCDAGVDADFDGVNQCEDCDDSDGSVFPGQTETCDGVDQDCDGSVDEDFDGDRDGFSTCGGDPALIDCDDEVATTCPDCEELCGAEGGGNGVDENCDGYADEVCSPCDATDDDRDGFSECDGDCNDDNVAVNPDATEICDGLDNDCNVNTTQNCDVSEPCNWDGGADDCAENAVCACSEDDSCASYFCVSFCQGSFTGPVGAGCTETQYCRYPVGRSANLHACAETTDTLGTKMGGASCSQDSECRSNHCTGGFPGGGPFGGGTCFDYCDHHEPGANGSCAEGAVCEIVSPSDSEMRAFCQSDDNGTGDTGDPCTSGCVWGEHACVDGVCAEPCGLEEHCDDGYHCSLFGNNVVAGTVERGPGAGETGIATVPVCIADSGAGTHDRPGGASCSRNGDCRSQYCERNMGVCLELCTTDASCASGMECSHHAVWVSGGVTVARVCLSNSLDFVMERM